MKYFYFFLLFTLLISFSGCTRENKAQSLIKEYLKKNLDDADSYEPVEFGTLNELYVDPVTRSLYRATLDRGVPIDDGSEADNQSKKGKNKLQGYYMKHTFRAKNKFGAYRKIESEFYFNPDVTEIIDQYIPNN